MAVPTRTVECSEGNTLVEMSPDDFEVLLEAAHDLAEQETYVTRRLLALALSYTSQAKDQT